MMLWGAPAARGPIRVVGTSPELPTAPGEWLPARGAAIIHDEGDQLLGKCNIYVVKSVAGLVGEGTTPEAAYVRAYPYWDNGGRSLPGLFEVPFSGWEHVATVRHIRYFRPDEGWLEHPFASPIRVSQRAGGIQAWKLSLPGGCLVNAKGFIIP